MGRWASIQKNVRDFSTQLLLINQSFQFKKKSYHKGHDDLSAWSIAVLPPASVLMSVDSVAIRGHSDVHGLYHHLGPVGVLGPLCQSGWPALPPRTMVISGPKLLRATSVSMVLLPLRSGLMCIARVTTGALGNHAC